MKTLILTRKDLQREARDLPIENIQYYHIAKSLEPYRKAEKVIFKDDDGETKIMKSRYGFTIFENNITTSEEFNKKYGNFLEDGYNGLSIDILEVVDFLDKIFSDLVKINSFKYFQIKLTFGMARFYAEGITPEIQFLVEDKLNQLIKEYYDKN